MRLNTASIKTTVVDRSAKFMYTTWYDSAVTWYKYIRYDTIVEDT